MRLFDIIGVLAVTLWVGVMGVYAFDRMTNASTYDLAMGEVLLHEGETWLTLEKNEVEVGYVQEVRTRLPEGWLIEYTMAMSIEVLSFEQIVETHVKSTMNSDGVLRQFSAEITAMNQTFRALGEASDEELRVTLYAPGVTPIQRKIPLDQPPRLAINAVQQFLASPDLKPGARMRQPFFDPATMQMTTMEYEYIGPQQVEVLEVQYDGHRFHQHVVGNPLETLVDDRGEILIQTFPMGILGYRVPPELARGQVAAWNRRVRDQGRQDVRSAAPSQAPFDVEAALDLLGNLRMPETTPLTQDTDETETP